MTTYYFTGLTPVSNAPTGKVLWFGEGEIVPPWAIVLLDPDQITETPPETP